MNRWPAEWIQPDWPVPAGVRACVTTRQGGTSLPPFDGFNLGTHVHDSPSAVADNRDLLQHSIGATPAWLEQIHSSVVIKADPAQCPTADASWSDVPGMACTVLTADCLPALFCDRRGTRVAAAHAGWRGLAGGVLEATLEALALPPEQLLVWLGPAIGPAAFEVGPEVREAFVATHPAAASAFVASASPGRYLADLYELARVRLNACGVTAVYGGGFCTFRDSRFYSYRRDAVTGRFASLVWLEPAPR
ncbi:peptidoglycan editing factor PgeF [Stutzerimonas tarimensis]|uniref:Purine nucleoside phosphorylase n=1 Tax=Stutzerimonas tarimensis TaxID=1507735 RepID=A0ABV7T280_9GAMM